MVRSVFIRVEHAWPRPLHSFTLSSGTVSSNLNLIIEKKGKDLFSFSNIVNQQMILNKKKMKKLLY